MGTTEDPYYAGPSIAVARFSVRDQVAAGEVETGTPAVANVPSVPAPEAPEPDAITVPEGSIKNVLAWVGDDRTKAQAALDAENATDDPRTTLVSKLEDILSA